MDQLTARCNLGFLGRNAVDLLLPSAELNPPTRKGSLSEQWRAPCDWGRGHRAGGTLLSPRLGPEAGNWLAQVPEQLSSDLSPGLRANDILKKGGIS